jgi:hypothetical protein
MWWVRHVKRVLKWAVIREETERRRDRRQMENAYYGAIYDIIASDVDAATKMVHLKEMNVRIVRLHARDGGRFFLDGADTDGMVDEAL